MCFPCCWIDVHRRRTIRMQPARCQQLKHNFTGHDANLTGHVKAPFQYSRRDVAIRAPLQRRRQGAAGHAATSEMQDATSSTPMHAVVNAATSRIQDATSSTPTQAAVHPAISRIQDATTSYGWCCQCRDLWDSGRVNKSFSATC